MPRTGDDHQALVRPELRLYNLIVKLPDLQRLREPPRLPCEAVTDRLYALVRQFVAVQADQVQPFRHLAMDPAGILSPPAVPACLRRAVLGDGVLAAPA